MLHLLRERMYDKCSVSWWGGGGMRYCEDLVVGQGGVAVVVGTGGARGDGLRNCSTTADYK